MHPRMHTDAYTHTEQAGGLHHWLYGWTLYAHTGALVRQLRDGRSRIVVHLVVAKVKQPRVLMPSGMRDAYPGA